MLVPVDLRYSHDHQWIRVEGDVWRVGITEFAQEALGEVTMVRIYGASGGVIEHRCTPSPISAGDEMGEIEAFKAMTDLYMPVDAVVVEANAAFDDSPTAVNNDPYGDGWLCTVRPNAASNVGNLLDAQAYRELIGYTDD